jgi:hypothetical protein
LGTVDQYIYQYGLCCVEDVRDVWIFLSMTSTCLWYVKCCIDSISLFCFCYVFCAWVIQMECFWKWAKSGNMSKSSDAPICDTVLLCHWFIGSRMAFCGISTHSSKRACISAWLMVGLTGGDEIAFCLCLWSAFCDKKAWWPEVLSQKFYPLFSRSGHMQFCLGTNAVFHGMTQ